jgi:hypothetical protein
MLCIVRVSVAESQTACITVAQQECLDAGGTCHAAFCAGVGCQEQRGMQYVLVQVDCPAGTGHKGTMPAASCFSTCTAACSVLTRHRLCHITMCCCILTSAAVCRCRWLQGSVREQLEALCDRSPVCAPAMLRGQRETIGQLQLEVETLQMRLQRSQAQVQQLQRQLKAAQAADQKD